MHFSISIVTLLLFSFGAIAKPLVHGHRGARSIYPENSLKAFEYALQVGVDALELDLALTKDNILVVSHEPWVNFDRCTHPERQVPKSRLLINSLSFAELQEFDCGSLAHPRFPKQKKVPGSRVPSLQQVFDLTSSWAKQNKKELPDFNIETKIVPRYPILSPSPQDFAKKLNDIVVKNKLSHKVIVQSFDYRSLAAIKKLNPKLRISFLNYESLPPYSSLAKDLKLDYISPNLDWITKEDVASMHKLGVQVVPWTANTATEWDYLIAIGVDAIITDDPEALIQHLKKRK